MLPAVDLATGYPVGVIIAGLGALAVAALLRPLAGRSLSFPMVLVGLGALLWSLPLDLPAPDPREHNTLALHVTELGVIVSLMGVGLKIDRVPNLRTWSATWRLLAITMPLTIAAIAWLGWWMVGLAPAAALLLGAVLAPTDPVLAADVQVGEPLEALGAHPDGLESEEAETTDPTGEDAEDELRFALTAEAGLNDTLAFPFTYLALLLLDPATSMSDWWLDWVLRDVLYRLVVGVAVGVVGGRLLARVLLRLSRETERDRAMTGVGALAATLLLYGATEVVSGYGFLAVFVGALVIRSRESRDEAYVSLHVFAEQVEQLLMAGVLVLTGGALVSGILADLTLPAVGLALLAIFVVRPVTGMVGLIGEDRMRPRDRVLASWFGIRGLGSLFYLAYALESGGFPNADLLWATTLLVVVLSVVLHGSSAAVLMRWRARTS